MPQGILLSPFYATRTHNLDQGGKETSIKEEEINIDLQRRQSRVCDNDNL